jgi:hypothetical protein
MRSAWPLLAPVLTIAIDLVATTSPLFGFAAPTAMAQSATGVVTRHLQSLGDLVPRVVNGVRAGGSYTTVGMLARGGFFQCSGTLIGCRTFLTAGHCVSEPFVPSQYSVFLQHYGLVDVAAIERPAEYEFNVRSDIAVVTLSSPITAITPSSINTVAEPPLGTTADIVGFGGIGALLGPGTSSYFAGIKRRGKVVTATCTSVPESSHLCWNFEEPIGPPGEDSNSCKGDSGGPLFADVPGLGAAVVGVTSAGGESCLAPDNAVDADVHFDHGWIESVADEELGGPSCGPVAPVLEPGAEVHFDRFAMDSSTEGVAYSFTVPAAASRLRVTTNGQFFPVQNYNLYVKQGGPASVADHDCASTRLNSFEACSFAFPAAGEWGVLVANPGSSEGEYDLTVSILGAASLGPCTPFDVDGDGALLPLTDGLLALRRLFGMSGAPLTTTAVSGDGLRELPAIEAFLDGCDSDLDVDGDGLLDALSDGLLFVRYLFGISGDALVTDAVRVGCTRCNAEAIESYLQGLVG